jgi:hypothetical protein
MIQATRRSHLRFLYSAVGPCGIPPPAIHDALGPAGSSITDWTSSWGAGQPRRQAKAATTCPHHHDSPCSPAHTATFVIPSHPTQSLRVLCPPVRRILQRSLEGGLLTYPCGHWSQTIRLIPPLTVTREQVDEGLAVFRKSVLAESP